MIRRILPLIFLTMAYISFTAETVTAQSCYNAVLEERMKYDPDGDGKIGLEVAINALQIAAGVRQAGQGNYTNSLNMNFKLIPSGTFIMGSPGNELGNYGDEIQHQVTITNPFYIQTTEVTQAQWEAVMGNNPSYFYKCGGDCPVESVSWYDVQSFLEKMNTRGEGIYRLPSEAEWEYAARAGKTTAFTTGDIKDAGCADMNMNAAGWYCGNAEKTTHPTAQKQPNNWGLYDIQGNVWEWCRDWYGEYPEDDVINPSGPYYGTDRILRGGSWYSHARSCRLAHRNRASGDSAHYDLGFRLVFEHN